MQSGEQSIHKYLIQRSKLGDRDAQNELYKLYVDAMYNICRRMMGDAEEAKDILQDSFIDAFTKIDKLKNDITFSAWIKRIVVNNCINALKKKKLLTSSIEDSFDVPDVNEANDHELDNYEIKRVLGAIDKISEGCKVVLNLYLFEGYDHKEIGQILNISESASKAQYSKAKAKIRKVLNN
ncbi:sigma-70 family RNA polymerase sigma factor [Fulvivirgaceae bacterium BMA10]|uniref:Sigma-70 family RNA polymerase sigma factor n=1 Tax=Splendidivirga corallicola TaxID=3051826 RepID=A0ABT8KLX7_9BACT|nr:sigma-70 family RNA polymerase sigma factor [Fulvivirgaceae bacterium BMA10]